MFRSWLGMLDMPVESALGVRLGVVIDGLYDPGEQRVDIILVAWGDDQPRNDLGTVPFDRVQALTADEMVLPDELDAASGLDVAIGANDRTAEGLWRIGPVVIGATVRLSSGKVAGTVVDMLFDPDDGAVRSYEVAPELPAGQTSMLPAHRALVFEISPDGQATIGVPREVAAVWRERSTGGISAVTMFEAMGMAEPTGDEDVEVMRGNPEMVD